MKKSILEILKRKNSKLLAIDKETAEKIEKMQKELDTSAEDIIVSALALLELSLGKEVHLLDKKNNHETTITALEGTTLT